MMKGRRAQGGSLALPTQFFAMQPDTTTLIQPIDYRAETKDQLSRSGVVSMACLAIGGLGAGYMIVFDWMPGLIAAMDLPSYMIILSFPLVSLAALVAGVVSIRWGGIRTTRWKAAVLAAGINCLVAGFGVMRIVQVIGALQRKWGSGGMGP